MTPKQKMKVLVEAAGERWHEIEFASRLIRCKTCGVAVACPDFIDVSRFTEEHANLSPTDLSALFELAEKLAEKLDPDEYHQAYMIERQTPEDRDNTGTKKYFAWFGTSVTTFDADTPAEALLEAIFYTAELL